jgi:hypothetical protein
MSALITPGIDYNNHISAILDLQDLDNFEFAVPWRSERPMLRTFIPTQTVALPYTPNPINPFFPVSSTSAEEANGFFRIVVVNELVGATSPCTDITINVYARCEDLEVAYPRQLEIEDFDNGERVSEGLFLPPTSEGPLDDVQIGGFDKEEMVLSPILGGEVTTGDNFKVVFGENVLSFRTLLKRFTKEFTAFTGAGTSNATSVDSNIYPYISGYLATVPSVSGLAATPDLSLYAYLKYAFLAVRGGYRRVVLVNGDGGSLPTYLSVSNIERYATDVPNITVGTNYFEVVPTLVGGALNPMDQNRSVAFETPSYTSARYSIGVALNGVAAPDYADEHMNGWMVTGNFDGDRANTFYLVAAAAADDFSLSGFVGCPPRITRSTPI